VTVDGALWFQIIFKLEILMQRETESALILFSNHTRSIKTKRKKVILVQNWHSAPLSGHSWHTGLLQFNGF
jgi:hypothetical protein